MSFALAPAAGRRAARSIRTPAAHALQHNAAARNLEVSPRHVAQNLLLQREFGYQPLQPAVFPLRFLQPLCLIQLQSPKVLPPPIVPLFADAYVPGRVRCFLAICYLHFNLPKQIHNLLLLIPHPSHVRSASSEFSLSSLGTQNPGHVSRINVFCQKKALVDRRLAHTVRKTPRPCLCKGMKI